jgi:hypothetical protein
LSRCDASAIHLQGQAIVDEGRYHFLVIGPRQVLPVIEFAFAPHGEATVVDAIEVLGVDTCRNGHWLWFQSFDDLRFPLGFDRPMPEVQEARLPGRRQDPVTITRMPHEAMSSHLGEALGHLIQRITP